MKNPFYAFGNWRRRALERARARGGLHLFWFYMSLGLAWSLFVSGSIFLVDLYHGRASGSGDVQARALIYFAGGLLFGLVMWLLQETPGTGRRDARR